jgi:RNA polymerase sigma-70 factor (ECF subfamily)
MEQADLMGAVPVPVRVPDSDPMDPTCDSAVAAAASGLVGREPLDAPRDGGEPTAKLESGSGTATTLARVRAPEDFRRWTKAICRGDERAFTEFYESYGRRLYRYLLVLAKGDEGAAREVLQTVVVKLARRFQVFDEERKLWSWLCRVAHNAYVDLLRSQRREQRFISAETPTPELVDDSGGEDALAESLHHALHQLSAADRELLQAAYVDQCPLQDLADRSGQTYKAVESRLARLRQKLKTNLLNHLRHEQPGKAIRP